MAKDNMKCMNVPDNTDCPIASAGWAAGLSPSTCSLSFSSLINAKINFVCKHLAADGLRPLRHSFFSSGGLLLTAAGVCFVLLRSPLNESFCCCQHLIFGSELFDHLSEVLVRIFNRHFRKSLFKIRPKSNFTGVVKAHCIIVIAWNDWRSVLQACDCHGYWILFFIFLSERLIYWLLLGCEEKKRQKKWFTKPNFEYQIMNTCNRSELLRSMKLKYWHKVHILR